MSIPLFPPSASTVAHDTDRLYFLLLALSLCVMAVVFLPLSYFLLKYRRGKKANRADLHLPTMKIEVTWTLIPTLISMGFFVAGAAVYFDEEVPPGKFLEVNVVGKQWMWKLEHQEGNAEINELHIPVNQDIKLVLGSEDVVHSFYIPAFRIKQDVVPGRFATEWFHPTQTGVYRFYCSEYCGLDHAKMEGYVYVLSPEEYAEWIARGAPKETLAQRGEQLYSELGCSGCHSGHAIVHAPQLEGLYGTTVALSDGTSVVADEKYLRDSILQPGTQIVSGYQPVMPAYQGHIREEQLMQLIAYVKSIAKTSPTISP